MTYKKKTASLRLLMLVDVNVVVGCTARKTIPVTRELQLGNIQYADITDRARRWIARLENSSEQKLPASELYAGDAWQIVKPFAKKHRLWIASAGYGLVTMRTPLHSYSATFAKRHPDSVVTHNHLERSNKESSVWWTELGKWQKSEQSVQTLTDLARTHPGGSILVVLSPEYLRAIEDDLCRSREFLSDPMQLVIISAGARKNGVLVDHFLPCDARLQAQLGGSRASLNCRIARKVLAETTSDKLNIGELKEKFTQFLNGSPVIMMHNRMPMNDTEVVAFIEKQIRLIPEISHSRLLAQLRAEGQACEQNRFKRLFQKVQRRLV